MSAPLRLCQRSAARHWLSSATTTSNPLMRRRRPLPTRSYHTSLPSSPFPQATRPSPRGGGQRRSLHSEAALLYYSASSSTLLATLEPHVLGGTVAVGVLVTATAGSMAFAEDEYFALEWDTTTNNEKGSSSSVEAKDSLIEAEQEEDLAVALEQDAEMEEWGHMLEEEEHDEKSLALTEEPSSLETEIPSISMVHAHGVELPTSKVLENGQTAALQSHFLRTFSWYGMELDIYVASLYRPATPETKTDVVKDDKEETIPIVANKDQDTANPQPPPTAPTDNTRSHNNLCVDVCLLYDYPASRIQSAWQYEMDHSVTQGDYAEYAQEKQQFLRLIGGGRRRTQPKTGNPEVSKPIIQSIQLIGDDTWVLEDGQVQGIIPGRHFQQAFSSMWFGTQPITTEFQTPTPQPPPQVPNTTTTTPSSTNTITTTVDDQTPAVKERPPELIPSKATVDTAPQSDDTRLLVESISNETSQEQDALPLSLAA
mmetsp:Transcript_2893/g.5831  ORF Transcript_2893/g.5831 Transcript_2893/m.5831 type:complete len:484 (-) Transcript_2893:1381-2832(-)